MFPFPPASLGLPWLVISPRLLFPPSYYSAHPPNAFSGPAARLFSGHECILTRVFMVLGPFNFRDPLRAAAGEVPFSRRLRRQDWPSSQIGFISLPLIFLRKSIFFSLIPDPSVLLRISIFSPFRSRLGTGRLMQRSFRDALREGPMLLLSGCLTISSLRSSPYYCLTLESFPNYSASKTSCRRPLPQFLPLG